MSSHPRPLLLLLAHGLQPADLGGLRAADPDRATPVQLHDVPDDPAAFVAGPGDASGALHDLGVAVDRSGLCLRSHDRSDEAVLRSLRGRPTGPAPVTVSTTTLVRDLGLTGGGGGATTAARCRAAEELDAWLTEVRLALRCGDLPEVWLVACDALQPVHRTFDFARHYERAFAWPLRRSLRAHISAEVAHVVAADQRAFEHAARALSRPPFAGHGELSSDGPGSLRFAAARGVAFGRRRVAVRRSGASTAVASMPLTAEPLPDRLSFADWLARFWLRALQLHAPDAREAAQVLGITRRLSGARGAAAGR